MKSHDILTKAGLKSLRALQAHNRCPSDSIRQQIQILGVHQRFQACGGSDRMGVPLGVPIYANGFTTRSFGAGKLSFTANGPKGGEEVKVARVEIVGIECLKESTSDQLSPSDEPYFQISIIGDQGKSAILNFAFENVTTGWRQEIGSVLVSATNLISPPLHIHVNAMEHDQGNRQKVEETVRNLVKEWEGVAKAAVQAVTGFTLPEETGYTSSWLKGAISNAVIDLFHWQDDKVGQGYKKVWELDATKESWTPLPILGKFGDNELDYNLKISVGNDTEGRYAVYFLCKLEITTGVRPT